MELSIAFQTNKKIHEYGQLAKVVENYGFDCVSVYNDMLYQPSWYPLFEMAKITKRIRLGPAAVNPFTSHPINIAGNIALLDEVSHGRAYLGIARGAWLDFIGLRPSKPVTSLKEAFIAVRYLLSGKKTGINSTIFPISEGDTLRWDIVRSSIPMMLGSWGKKTIEACYPHINEIKLGGTANPLVVKHYKEFLLHIKKAANHSHQPGIVAGAVCVVDEDGEKAHDLARKEVALYLPVVMKLDPTLSLPETVIDEIENAAHKFDYQMISRLIDDDLLNKFALAGTPEDIIKQCILLGKAGTTRIEFGTPHGLDRDKGVHLLGEEVLPAIQAHFNDT